MSGSTPCLLPNLETMQRIREVVSVYSALIALQVLSTVLGWETPHFSKLCNP